MNCGDILLVHFPFTNGSAAKLRPVLVVSEDRFNQGDDIVVLPISSQPDPGDPFSYYIDTSLPKFRSTNLRMSSSVKWTKPLTIDKRTATRRLGTLHPDCLEEIRSRLRSLFSPTTTA